MMTWFVLGSPVSLTPDLFQLGPRGYEALVFLSCCFPGKEAVFEQIFLRASFISFEAKLPRFYR